VLQRIILETADHKTFIGDWWRLQRPLNFMVSPPSRQQGTNFRGIYCHQQHGNNKPTWDNPHIPITKRVQLRDVTKLSVVKDLVASDHNKFISRFDKLFDIFNSSSVSSNKLYNKAFKGEEEQINFLQDMLLFLN
jgi:hypothetical protein